MSNTGSAQLCYRMLRRLRPYSRCRIFWLIFVVGLTHSWWLAALGGWLIVADPLQPVDAVVPLAGDPLRIPWAAQLWRQQRAPWFVATSMPMAGGSYGAFVKQQAIENGVDDAAIIMPAAVATTTYGEALILREVAQAQGWRSLLIVTSPSHTRRARMIFRAIFAHTGITIVMRPVEHHWYRAETWWRSWNGLRETWMEYTKLALYQIGYHAVTPNRQ